MILERSIIRFLYGRPLETLLATFGVSLVLQQLVRSVFSANNRSVETPAWMSGTLQINGALSITYNRLYIVIFTMIVFAILQAVLKRTRLGLEIRAVAQNRAMAQAMGIRTEWVDALTFGLGSGIAGIAGVALSQFTNVGPNLGQSYIIDSFMVVVFGGVGNLWGTLVGGISMGVVNQLLEPYAGAVLAKIIVLVALILFVQRWPRGLFPQTGRAAESLSSSMSTPPRLSSETTFSTWTSSSNTTTSSASLSESSSFPADKSVTVKLEAADEAVEDKALALFVNGFADPARGPLGRPIGDRSATTLDVGNRPSSALFFGSAGLAP